MSNLILKTLAGSRAYGLAVEGSDWDYHGVFVTPTSELLAIGQRPRDSVWKEGDEDFQSWELGHFLHLAAHCNPTVLETFVATPVETTPHGYQLRALFGAVLSRRRARDAFLGYAHNQRAKLFKKPDDPTAAQPGDRVWKFAAQYLRILLQGEELLRTGKLELDMKKYDIAGIPAKPFLLDVKSGFFSMGYVIDKAAALEKQLEAAYGASRVPEEADLGAVNGYLLRVRRESWE